MSRSLWLILILSVVLSAGCRRDRHDDVLNNQEPTQVVAFEDDGEHGEPRVGTLEDNGAPAGTDLVAELFRAQHDIGRPTDDELRALDDPAGTLLAIEENAASMGERTRALRAMHVTSDARARARLLDILDGESNHVALREAAALGLRGMDLQDDHEVREALERAAASPDARLAAAAQRALGR